MPQNRISKNGHTIKYKITTPWNSFEIHQHQTSSGCRELIKKR